MKYRVFFYEAFEEKKREIENFYFVTISRGERCDTQALLDNLNSRKILGAAVDVYPDEPQLADVLRAKNRTPSPSTELTLRLGEHPMVICTPHNAFNTQEAVKLKASQSVQSIMDFIATGKFTHPVL